MSEFLRDEGATEALAKRLAAAMPSSTAVYHVDLYRVSSEEELRYLGWTELDEGFRIVEWPDRAPGIAAQADICVEFEYEEPGRRAEVVGLSPDGERIVARLDAATATDPVD